jgi:hypothetical protein
LLIPSWSPSFLLDGSISTDWAKNAAEGPAIFDMPPFQESNRQASYKPTLRAFGTNSTGQAYYVNLIPNSRAFGNGQMRLR